MLVATLLITLCIDIDGYQSNVAYLFFPMPDSSHVRDLAEIAKSTCLLLKGKGQDNCKDTIYLATLQNMEPVAQKLSLFNNEPTFTVISHKNNNDIAAAAEQFKHFSMSIAPKSERVMLATKILNLPYELTLDILKHAMKEINKPKARVFLVIDVAASAAIDFAESQSLDFVIINIIPTILLNKNVPQYLSEYPFSSNSLTRRRRTLNEQGVMPYLMSRFYDLFLLSSLIRNSFSIINDLNERRKSNGVTPKYDLFFQSTEKVFVHFILPGFFEYSFPMEPNHYYVGYKTESKQQVMDKKPSLFQNHSKELEVNLPDSDIISWMDSRKEYGVAYIAFGTKVEISLQHMTSIIESIENANSNLSIICVYSNPDLQKQYANKAHILFQSWINQPLILSHPSTRFFISHGGAHSIFESIEEQVPLLIFPIFGDQFANGRRVEDAGIGFSISEELEPVPNLFQISTMIHHILDNQSTMKENMRIIKEANQRQSKMSIQTLLSLSHLPLHNMTQHVSINTLAAADIVMQVGQVGTQNFLKDTTRGLSSLEQLNMIHFSVALLVTSILSAIFLSCCVFKRR